MKIVNEKLFKSDRMTERKTYAHKKYTDETTLHTRLI